MCQPLRVSPHTRERRFCRNTPRWSSTISGIYDDGGATGETWDAVTERKSIETRTRETKRDHSTSLAITRLSPSCRVGSSLPVTPCSFGRARRHSATFGGARLRMAVRGGARRRSATLGRSRQRSADPPERTMTFSRHYRRDRRNVRTCFPIPLVSFGFCVTHSLICAYAFQRF